MSRGASLVVDATFQVCSSVACGTVARLLARPGAWAESACRVSRAAAGIAVEKRNPAKLERHDRAMIICVAMIKKSGFTFA